MVEFYGLSQQGHALLEEIGKIRNTVTVYRLGKPFLSPRELRQLETFERAFGSVVDPLSNIRNAFFEWSAQCDLALAHYRRTVQVRVFERGRNALGKLLGRRRPDYSLIASTMKQVLLSLEVVQRTAIPIEAAVPVVRVPPGATEVIAVEKGKPFTALKQIEGIFERATGYLKLMDKWIGDRTLDFIWKVPMHVPVKILVGVVEEKSKTRFEVAYSRLKTERPLTEVRKCRSEALHDRYIISQNEFWMSGPSLKDLGIAKWGLVAKIGDPTKKAEVEKRFEDLWVGARPISSS